MNDGVLYCRYDDHQSKTEHWQLVVPKCMQEHILSESHAGQQVDILDMTKPFAK